MRLRVLMKRKELNSLNNRKNRCNNFISGNFWSEFELLNKTYSLFVENQFAEVS